MRQEPAQAKASLSLLFLAPTIATCSRTLAQSVARTDRKHTNRIADDHLSSENVRARERARPRTRSVGANGYRAYKRGLYRGGNTQKRTRRSRSRRKRRSANVGEIRWWRKETVKKSPCTYRVSPGRVIFLSSTLRQERVNNPRLGVQRLMAVESGIY